MPMYYFRCDACADEVQRIITPAQSKQPLLCVCGAVLVRAPRGPSSHVMERLDNTHMTKAVERFSEAPRLGHEHAKGKKTAI